MASDGFAVRGIYLDFFDVGQGFHFVEPAAADDADFACAVIG